MPQILEAIPLECAWHNPDYIRRLHLGLVERPQERLITISDNQLRGPSVTIEFTLARIEEYDARYSLGGPMSDRQQFVESSLQTIGRKPDTGSCRTRGGLASQPRRQANRRIRARKIFWTDRGCIRKQPVVKLMIGNLGAMLQMQLRFVVKAPVHGSCRGYQATVALHTGVLHPDTSIRLNITDKERAGSSPPASDVAEGAIRMSGPGKCPNP